MFQRIINSQPSSRSNDVSISYDANSSTNDRRESSVDFPTSDFVDIESQASACNSSVLHGATTAGEAHSDSLCTCPICGECVNASCSTINCHIDECLARAASESDADSCSARVNISANENDASTERSSKSVTDAVDEQSLFVCPVCNIPQAAKSINQHIDECLNRDLLRDSRSSDPESR